MPDPVAELVETLRPLIADERVLEAIATVPRERFVNPRDIPRAYENTALGIGCGQTISQPLVVARMLELLALRPTDRILDVGTGSGYHAALLGVLGGQVWTVERHAELSAEARSAIGELGLSNIAFHVGDGTEGLPAQAPFDAINVAAAASAEVPPQLLDQLAVGGRMVVPVGDRAQHLVLVRRQADGINQLVCDPVRFVPLVRG